MSASVLTLRKAICPDVACGDTGTRIMLALASGARDYGDLMAATGLCRASLSGQLHRLRIAGLVTWDEGKRGTVRALVGPT